MMMMMMMMMMIPIIMMMMLTMMMMMMSSCMLGVAHRLHIRWCEVMVLVGGSANMRTTAAGAQLHAQGGAPTANTAVLGIGFDWGEGEHENSSGRRSCWGRRTDASFATIYLHSYRHMLRALSRWQQQQHGTALIHIRQPKTLPSM
jgi:hypothetical protein